MDVLFNYRGQQFIWNLEKGIANAAKHGVRFETACGAFFDRLGTFEDASVDEEERLALIGMSESFELLFVVHLEQDGEAIRIISAREASAQERKRYENGG